ncbi:MAG: aldehyde ferredoxin oxidoreductase N-terminal domain-containing protein [bacterium]
MDGYAGKILRINLTERTKTIMSTSRYAQWIGGHGLGSAIFYDLTVREKNINLSAMDGFSPENVITVMSSPISGTLVPCGSGRTEVQGIGIQSFPIGWYTRSNVGGRFSAMMKYAGWDGLVIEGAADIPVWVDIRDDSVRIRECSRLSLWGTDAWECQQIIWDFVNGSSHGYDERDWVKPGSRSSFTTQRPAVLAIARAGETLCRTACLIHDAGNAAGQGGFGGVWGSKKLKAVSVIGTGSFRISDPNALMEARLRQKKQYAYNFESPKPAIFSHFAKSPGQLASPLQKQKGGQRPQACLGCQSGCRRRYESGIANEGQCVETMLSLEARDDKEAKFKGTDLVNRYGINAYEILHLAYLRDLYEMGVLGPGRKIPCDLDFHTFGSLEFLERYLILMSNRDTEFGYAVGEGLFRAAMMWGRLEEDLREELLPYPYHGLPEHGYDPRAELEWGYGTILGDRDINEHDFNGLYWDPTVNCYLEFRRPLATAEEAVTIFTDKMIPFQGDRLMLDYSTENMYSEHIVKLVAWHRRYTRFWKQSVLLCDWAWPDMLNLNRPDKRGSTPEAEPTFLRAVTGLDLSFEEGMELGRKLWNLDNAIWALQGRHRDMLQFAEYIYTRPFGGQVMPFYRMPGLDRKDGQWKYLDLAGRWLDRDRFEQWKTAYYLFEGWDPRTGHPERETLEGLGLGYVADRLEQEDQGRGKSCLSFFSCPGGEEG